MRLKSLDYSQYHGQPEEWTLDGLTLGDINLLVGKNASGKSRILNVIHNLAQSIAGTRAIKDGLFSLIFDENGTEIKYEVHILGSKVIKEIFEKEIFETDNNIQLTRETGGEGKIFAVRENKKIDFHTPENQLAVVARRDKIQHPFFEPLHEWASSLYHYSFGTPLGQQQLFAVLGEGGPGVDLKNSSQVVAIFREGQKAFGDDFLKAVREDFMAIGYDIEDVGIAPPRGVKIEGSISTEVSGMYVKETDLPANTDQLSMSQGMFRALSIIVQINYSVLAHTPSCILVDDIGEGLDFDRSCNLIELLMAKAKTSSVQLILATNDRFVMNRVPLEAWSVVHREGNHVEIKNYTNSKEVFDNFKFTGLNNFDFLAFDYLHADATDE